MRSFISTLQQFEGEGYDLHIKLRDVISAIGEERVQEYVAEATRLASHIDAYEKTADNISSCWVMLIVFSLGFAALATVSLEFIDKDKR